MMDNQDLINLGDEAAAMVRFELMLPENMRDWMKTAARQRGQTSSAYIRLLIAEDLTRQYGRGWMQGHRTGDLDVASAA